MLNNKESRRNKYFEIFMLTLNTDNTLEEIGVKYKISKQRVWQIVRFNKLGGGDYFLGYKKYDEYKKLLLLNQKLSTIERRRLMRDWLKERNVRLIKSRNDEEKQDVKI